jgi:hypothetical protein
MTDHDPSFHIELNRVESFCYFWKSVWISDEMRKPKLSIADTLLFSSDGSLHSWLFTSKQTGEIMKKKPEKLENPHFPSIVSSFKRKSQLFRGYKSKELKNKIAIVWFVRTNKTLSSYLVSEKELLSILNSELREILAIQVYVGGFSLKGNGIFLHRIIRDSKDSSSLLHQSFEYLDTPVSPDPSATTASCYTNKNKKIPLIEYPYVDTLKAFGTYLLNHIELNCGELSSSFNSKQSDIGRVPDPVSNLLTTSSQRRQQNVDYLSFQVAFNSLLEPTLIAVTKLHLSDVSVKFYHQFDSVVYLNGASPSYPSFYEQSALLPSISVHPDAGHKGERGGAHRSTAFSKTIDDFGDHHSVSSCHTHSHSHSSSLPTHPHASLPGTVTIIPSHGLEIIPEDIIEPAKIRMNNSSEFIIIPPPDLASKPSYFKTANADYSLRKDYPDLPFVSPEDNNYRTLIARSETRSVAYPHGTTAFSVGGNSSGGSGSGRVATDGKRKRKDSAKQKPHRPSSASAIVRDLSPPIFKKQDLTFQPLLKGKRQMNVVEAALAHFQKTMGITNQMLEEVLSNPVSNDQKSLSEEEGHDQEAAEKNILASRLPPKRPISANLRIHESVKEREVDAGNPLRSSSARNSEQRSKHYETSTDGYKPRTTFHGDDINNNSEPLSKIVKQKRPISAPHSRYFLIFY